MPELNLSLPEYSEYILSQSAYYNIKPILAPYVSVIVSLLYFA
jgi:hypothetical protein